MYDPEQMRTRSVDEYNGERQQAAEGLEKTNAYFSSNPQAFQKLTPEQTDYIKNFHGSADDLTKYYGSINPNLSNLYGNGLASNGADMWWTPQQGPRHTDNGGPLSAGSLLTGGLDVGEQGQSDWNDMRTGLGIMALPFVGAGITAGLGAAGAGAGAAGAGAAEGGAAATGVDASTGLFAGESATSGAAGVGATGTVSGGAGSASLIGGAGSDTAASMPAATAEADPLGGYNIDPNTGDVFYGSGDNPYGSNFSGGTGNEGFSGYQPGFLEQAQSQATALAKQFGLTPAAALQAVLKAAGRAAPSALGAIGANKQRQSLEALTQQYMDLGAPSRARYEASYAPGFTMANEPGYKDALDQTTKATLHGLSVNGNPAGSPNAWEQTLSDVNAKMAFPALQNFRNTNANAGGIASLQTAAPGVATSAINAGSNVFNAVGAGANDIFNPQKTLAQQIAEYQQMMKQGSGAVM